MLNHQLKAAQRFRQRQLHREVEIRLGKTKKSTGRSGSKVLSFFIGLCWFADGFWMVFEWFLRDTVVVFEWSLVVLMV